MPEPTTKNEDKNAHLRHKMNKNVCHNFTFQVVVKNDYYLKMYTDLQRASNINLLRIARHVRPFRKGQFDDKLPWEYWNEKT